MLVDNQGLTYTHKIPIQASLNTPWHTLAALPLHTAGAQTFNVVDIDFNQAYIYLIIF